MNAEAVEDIRRIAESCEGVVTAGRPLTVYFGPDFILLALDVEFEHGLSAPELTSAVDRVECAVRHKYPKVRRIYIEAESLSASQSRLVR